MDNTCKQMCMCFKVICCVLANLTRRLYSETLDLAYKMCIFCCCSSHSQESGKCALIGESPEAFYKNVGREGAEKLLMNKQNGTFIIRPSKRSPLGTMSIVQDFRVFHLNIRIREDDYVAMGEEKDNEKCFNSLNSLINYYVSNYLILCSEGNRTVTLLLPYTD
ncbi:tyrosine-protein kinase Src64B [Euwallacea fornicatus]|uniref:tyrosine-protein kinase Src64B n=1 Tax=Euwallacea fornicatus TaxID=995702 RepID=UPI00338EE6F5